MTSEDDGRHGRGRGARHRGRRGRWRRGARHVALGTSVLLAALGIMLVWSGIGSPTYSDIVVAEDTVAGDGFGSSVAISGRTLAVGAFRESDPPDHRGALYVGEHVEGHRWSERSKLVAPDAAAGDQNGYSVALDGDWLAVGAIGDFGRKAIGRSSGRVHVYRRDDGHWTQRATLTRPGGENDDDRYGFSLAIADGVLVVGARGVDEDTGAVYVHRLEAPDPAPFELRAPEGSVGDRFGEAVAFDGHTILVGAPGHDGAAIEAGAVYAFGADGKGWRAQVPALVSPTPEPRARFGVGVGVEGEHAVIGSSHWRHDGAPGRVWFVSRDPTGIWGTPSAPLAGDGAPPVSSPDDMEGFRVAIDGNLAVAGAHLADARGKDSGAVVVYVRDTEGWHRTARVFPPDGDADDRYGIALALDGGIVLVGAEQADARGRESGGVYLVEAAGSEP